MKLVVFFPPVTEEIERRNESWHGVDPEPCSASLSNFFSEILNSDGAILVGWANSDIREGVNVRLDAHSTAGEVVFSTSHSIKSKVGHVSGIS